MRTRLKLRCRMEIRNKLVTFLRGTCVQMFSLDYPWGEEGSVQSLLESQDSFDFLKSLFSTLNLFLNEWQ